jgi:predicted nucleic acid-binding Zn ribbon protein
MAQLIHEIPQPVVRNENTCVCCGATIPEGQQVCPNCLLYVRKENDNVND